MPYIFTCRIILFYTYVP